MEANPQRWLFGHEHDAFAAAGPRPGVPPVFWPPLFAAADAKPDAASGAWRDGGHCSAELVAAHAGAQWGGAQGGGGGGGGRFVNGRNGAYASTSPVSRSEDGDGDRSDAGRDAGPSSDGGGGALSRREENGHRGARGAGLLALGNGGDASCNGTIPEIASDAALAELQARIREDCMALRQVRRGGRAADAQARAAALATPPALSSPSAARKTRLRARPRACPHTRTPPSPPIPPRPQFRAETDEQWAHLGALRSELEDVQVALSTLSEKRTQLSAEAEDEERRIGDARRLRSSLRKGLHDAQKRVDGAGHRSRGALRQLQRLLAQASTFVAVEEEVANGGAAPPDGDAQPALPDVEDCMSDRHALAGALRVARCAHTPAPPVSFQGLPRCTALTRHTHATHTHTQV
jgi:hypothetical protein